MRLVVHRDRDYMSTDDAKRFDERLKRESIAPLLTAENDIELVFYIGCPPTRTKSCVSEGRFGS